MKNFHYLLIAVFATPTVLFAEEPVDLDQVIVTATRTPMSLEDTLAPTLVISRDEIEHSQAIDAAELLRFHAGIDIGRNGGAGQATSIFIRGTESNHTLVLIDGVEMNPGTLGGAAIQNVPLEAIERIEIVKGPRSSLYGSEAIGGVINIITRRPESGLQVSANAGVGSFSTKRLAASVQKSNGTFNVGLVAEYIDTDGFPTRQASNQDRGHDNRNINFRIGSRFSNTDVEFRTWQAQGNTEYSGFFLEPLDQDFLNRVTAVDIGSQVSENWYSNILLSHVEDEVDQNQRNFLGDLDFVTTSRNVLDWQNDVRLSASNLLTAGLYISREDTESLSFGTRFDVSTDVDAFYLQDAIRFDQQQLVLALRQTDHQTAGSETTWNADYGIKLNRRLRFTAAAGTAFRAPDSTDRFGFGGNPNLRAETARNLEIGLRLKLSSSQNLGISVFDTQIDDLIVIDFTQFPSVAQNVDKASIRGIELRHDLVAGNWRFSNEIILQDTEDEQTGEPLPRRADRSLSSRVTRSFGQHEIGINLLATSERKDSPFSQIDNAGYVLLNLQGRLRINRRLVLAGNIENLLDREYQTAAGFNSPDRSVFVSLNYTIR